MKPFKYLRSDNLEVEIAWYVASYNKEFATLTNPLTYFRLHEASRKWLQYALVYFAVVGKRNLKQHSFR